MIMICTRKCFFLDKSVRPGTPVDIPDTLLDTDLVKSSFRAPEGKEGPSAEAKAKELDEKADLTATELKRRLDQMGVAYRGNSSREALDKLYKEQVELRADAAKE